MISVKTEQLDNSNSKPGTKVKEYIDANKEASKDLKNKLKNRTLK